MTLEKHPYGVFVPKKPKVMIVGSFPIGKFTNPKRKSEIKTHEYNFFFGGEKNLLWKILADVFDVSLISENDILKLLEKHGIGIGDVIESCRRKEGRASDSDLYDIHWNRELLDIIHRNKIKKIFFTSKKVEVWFNKLFPHTDDLEKMTLISPSAQTLRSLGQREDFKRWVKEHPHDPKINFILEDYHRNFKQALNSDT